MAPLPVRLVSYVLHFSFVLLTNIYTIPAYLVWMILLMPLRFLCHEIYWAIEAFMFNGLLSMVVTWFKIGGYKIIEAGDDISSLFNKEAVLLSNHQCTVDVPSIMASVFSKPNVGGRLMWIMDTMFKYTHFGLCSQLRSDFFISQGKSGRAMQLLNLKQHLKTAYHSTIKKWILIFPEGGFLFKRKETSQSFAKKNGLPFLEHVTYPRAGAFQGILDTIGCCNKPQENGLTNGGTTEDLTSKSTGFFSTRTLEWIIDLTIAYPKGQALDLFGVACSYIPSCDILFHYRAYPVKDLPIDYDGLLKWIYDRYIEKEAFLAEYYKTGQIPTSFNETSAGALKTTTPKYIKDNMFHVLLYHIFFTISTFLQILIFYLPLANLMYAIF